MIGEYERAFYGSQYALMAPLFEHYGIGLWMPEVGGRVDWHAEDHEQAMLALGLSSKREITRTRIRVRTAMAAQTREQGRYLGGRPPCGYRLADAGSHPNKAHAAWGRRAHRLEPDPVTAPVVRWMFAQQLAGHSAARITRALNDAGVPCPSAARTRPGTRTGRGRGGRYAPSPPSWRTRGIRAGRCGTGSAPTSTWPTRLIPGSGTSRCSGGTCPKAGSSPGTRHMRRWSARPISSPSRTRPRRAARPVPLPAGTCWPGCWRAGGAGEAGTAWSNGRPAYRCRHGHTSATAPGPGRPGNTYVREDQILPHLAAISILLAGSAGTPGRGSCDVTPVTGPADTAGLIDRMRADGLVLTYDPDDQTLRAGSLDAPPVTIGNNH